MLAVGLLAACGCTKREWALHRCFELMKGLEASQALLQTKTGEAKTWFGRQRALETLAMQSFDIIFDIDASERQVVVGTSRHVNLFFKQDMEGIPLSSVLPPYERMKLDRSLHEVVQSRSGARAILILPRGEARVCLEYCGDLGQVLVAIELQEKRGRSPRTQRICGSPRRYSGESAPRAGVQTGARWPWT
ncbi:unnamed protein product [Effrenium voratum]|nr:unnamed protein product [Effrenium voratum]